MLSLSIDPRALVDFSSLHVYRNRSLGAVWVQLPSHCFALHDDDDVSILSGLLPETEEERARDKRDRVLTNGAVKRRGKEGTKDFPSVTTGQYFDLGGGV